MAGGYQSVHNNSSPSRRKATLVLGHEMFKKVLGRKASMETVAVHDCSLNRKGERVGDNSVTRRSGRGTLPGL